MGDLTHSEMIAKFLENNEVKVLPDPEINDGYTDYRRSKKTYNELNANKKVMAVNVKDSSMVKLKNQKLDDGGSLDAISHIKPIDKYGLIGKRFYDRNRIDIIEIIDFDYFENAKTQRGIERYVGSNGVKYTKTQLINRKFIDDEES